MAGVPTLVPGDEPPSVSELGAMAKEVSARLQAQRMTPADKFAEESVQRISHLERHAARVAKVASAVPPRSTGPPGPQALRGASQLPLRLPSVLAYQATGSHRRASGRSTGGAPRAPT